jgi:hypothetical protein
MIEEQNGLCAICKLPFSATARPVVDHKVGIRAILHHRCNIALGYVEKVIEEGLLKDMITYIGNYNA